MMNNIRTSGLTTAQIGAVIAAEMNVSPRIYFDSNPKESEKLSMEWFTGKDFEKHVIKSFYESAVAESQPAWLKYKTKSKSFYEQAAAKLQRNWLMPLNCDFAICDDTSAFAFVLAPTGISPTVKITMIAQAVRKASAIKIGGLAWPTYS